MDCIFCGPQVTIEKGKGSCPICHATVYLIYNDTINAKLGKTKLSKGVTGKAEETGVGMYAWAKEYAAELYTDMQEKLEEVNKLFGEGEKAVSGQRFDAAHYDEFCKALQCYGNSENKIFIAYMKADIEVLEDAAFINDWEKPPVQGEMSLNG